MNRLCVVFFLLFLMISCSFFELLFLDKCTKSLISDLNQIKVKILNKDSKAIVNAINKLKKNWDRKKSLLLTFTNKDTINKITQLIQNFEFDYLQIFYRVNKCIFLIRLIFENEKIIFENIW